MALDLLCFCLAGYACAMTLDQATKLIESCAGQMDARYKKVVFDEWAVVSLSAGKGRVLAYIGPRKARQQLRHVKQ